MKAEGGNPGQLVSVDLAFNSKCKKQVKCLSQVQNPGHRIPHIPYSQDPCSLDALTAETDGQADIVLLGGKTLSCQWESWSQAEGS